MEERYKIISQILIVAESNDIEIIRINFTNIDNILDEVEFTFKIKHVNFRIKYIYEKNSKYEVNTAGCYIKYKLAELLKEE